MPREAWATVMRKEKKIIATNKGVYSIIDLQIE